MKLYKSLLVLTTIILLGYLTIAQTNNSESPVVVSAFAPPYPLIAKYAKAKGDVFVDVEIDNSGKVTSAKASDAYPLLRRISEEAAHRWIFAQAPNGREKRKVRLTFSFKILPKETSGLEATAVFYPPYKIEVRAIEVNVD
jgi:TonB family protein